jgi:chaperonin GroES
MKKNTSQKTVHKAKVSDYRDIVPLGDRVLLRPLSQEDLKTTMSGIIIPDTVHKEKPEQGIVIAVGEGKLVDGVKVPLSVKVGDKVVFSRYGYDEIKLNDEEFYILKEENLLAIIR